MGVVAGAEGEAGRKADVLLGKHAAHEVEARPQPAHARKGVEGARRLVQFDARMRRQHPHDRRSAGPVTLAQFAHERFALRQGRDARPLDERRGARVAALGHRGHLLAVARGDDHPAEPPAGHGERLGEAVDDDQRVVRRGNRQKRRCGVAREDVAVIHLVGDDDDAARTAEIEQPLLFGARHDPAGRVAGCVEKQGFRLGLDRGEQVVEIEPPAVRSETLPHEVEGRARHLERTVDVGPVRTDDQAVIARTEGHARGQGNAQHGRTGHRDPVRGEVDAVQPVEILLDGFAQVGPARGMVVESQPLVECLFGGLADERGGDEVALAEPQRNDRRIADARQPDAGDAILFEGFEFVAQHVHGERLVWRRKHNRGGWNSATRHVNGSTAAGGQWV